MLIILARVLEDFLVSGTDIHSLWCLRQATAQQLSEIYINYNDILGLQNLKIVLKACMCKCIATLLGNMLGYCLL